MVVDLVVSEMKMQHAGTTDTKKDWGAERKVSLKVISMWQVGQVVRVVAVVDGQVCLELVSRCQSESLHFVSLGS